MANPNQVNDAHEMQAGANKEWLNRKQEEWIVKWEARAMMKDLMAEVANPFAISQEQGEQYADSGQTMSDATVSDKEVLASCDADGNGVIKGLKERGCEIKMGNEVLKKEIAADKKEIEASKAQIEANKAEIEKIRQRLINKTSN